MLLEESIFVYVRYEFQDLEYKNKIDNNLKSTFIYIFSLGKVHSGLEVGWLEKWEVEMGKWKWVFGGRHVTHTGSWKKWQLAIKGGRKIQTKHESVSSCDSLIWVIGFNRPLQPCTENYNSIINDAYNDDSSSLYKSWSLFQYTLLKRWNESKAKNNFYKYLCQKYLKYF